MDPSMATPQRKLTYDDWLLFPEDGMRHELIEGEHFVTSTPVLRHQAIVKNLLIELEPMIRERRLGWLHVSPLAVILSDHDVVVPDLLYVQTENEGILEEWVRGAPDLAIEVLSPSTRRRDETLKRDLYERMGVGEYWIVDPEADSIKVYRADEGVYGRPELLLASTDDTLISPLFPDFELAIESVFRE